MSGKGKSKKKGGAKKARRSTNSHIRIKGTTASINSAPKRHPKLFKALHLLTSDAAKALGKSTVLPASPTALQTVDYHIWMKSFNAIKGAKLLMEHDHWELAQGMVRQLFELLLALEEIRRQADPEAAATTYLRFGMLQEAQQLLAHVRYTADTGRGDNATGATVASMDNALPAMFPEFWRTDKNGNNYWAKSWTPINARDLAEASGDLRLSQYELCFRPASTHIHAGPGAVSGWPKELQATVESVAKSVKRENGQLGETGALVMTFFVQIWAHCIDVMPFVRGPAEYQSLLVDAMQETHDALPWQDVRDGTHVVPASPFARARS